MTKPKKAHLTEGSVVRKLAEMTVPMTIGLFSIVLFNLVDMFFVGRLGTQELAALSFTFPVVTTIGSFALGIGTGVSAVISRAIGGGDQHKAQELTTDSILLSIITSIVFTVAGIMTMGPIFKVLGAGEEIIPAVRGYMDIWYSGLIFLVIPMVGNNAIRATGDIKRPALVMIFAVVLNAVLDPLLIFGIGPFPSLGISGAALATVISRAVTLFLSLYILHFQKNMLCFERRAFDRILSSWKSILYLGIPTAATRLIMPIAMAIIVRLVASYGPEAVAGFGVASRIEFFALTVVISLATVLGPFVGQNWGAGMNGRVVSGVNVSKIFSMVWGLVMFVFLVLAAEPLVKVFNDDPVVIETASMYLKLVPLGYGLFGTLIISAMTLTVLHRPFSATGLMAFPMIVLYLPIALLGSHLAGLAGIFAALLVAYVTGGVLSNFVLGKTMRALRENLVTC